MLLIELKGLSLLLLLLLAFLVTAIGQAGKGFAISADSTPSLLREDDDCQGEANERWVDFGIKLKENPQHIGRLLKGNFLEVASAESIPLIREFGYSPLISIAICSTDLQLENKPRRAKPIGASIDVLSLWWFYQDSRSSLDAEFLTIDCQVYGIDYRNPQLISSNHILNKRFVMTKGIIIIPAHGCHQITKEKGECLGTFIFYESGQHLYRRTRVKLLIYDLSPGWEIIELGAPVLRFHALGVATSQYQAMLQKKYLSRCGSAGLSLEATTNTSDGQSVRSHDNALRRNHINNRGGIRGSRRSNKDDCEIEITY